MLEDLIRPNEVDKIFLWPAGRAQRLARRGRLPHVVLPDGKTIRFDRAEVEALVKRVPVTPAAGKNGGRA